MSKTLEQIANEYVTQDNMSTRHPIAFVITEIYEQPTVDNEPGDCLMCITDGDCLEFECINEAKRYIIDTYNPDTDEEIELEDYFDHILWYERVRRQSNFTHQMFLTKSSIEDHMKANKHHYNEPEYLLINAAWRNNEMELFIRDLYKHATVSQDEWNYEALRYYKHEVTS